jgi:hypothetical protein
MRWFRRAPAQVRDTGRQDALVQEIRSRFGPRTQVAYRAQVDALTRMLDGDDGLLVAVRILADVAREAQADVLRQVAEINRRYPLSSETYHGLWRAAAPDLRFPLFALPCGFFPYVHVPAALAVIGGSARRCIRLTDARPLLGNMFDIVDLTTAGWEFGRVPVDADAAFLMRGLIATAAKVRTAVGDEPPSLPSPIRNLMRRNNTTAVHDPTGHTVIGGINLGAEMRPAFLT